MYVHSVKLINFKSIGNYPENEVILEPRVTAIIGKNESGKSNVLDGLSYIDFMKNNPVAFSQEIVNRCHGSSTENSYEVVLKPSVDEVNMGLNGDTKIVMTKKQCLVTGGFLEYYKKYVMSDFEAVVSTLETIGSNPFQVRDQEWLNYKTYMQELGEKEQLDLHKRMQALAFFDARILKITVEHRSEIEQVLKTAEKNWLDLTRMLPVFFYRKMDKHLKTQYRFADIEKEVKNPMVAPDSLLFDFVKLIDISQDDFILAAQSGNLANQETLRRKINKQINKKINKPFREFYQTETITLDVSFNAGNISFAVQSEDGEALLLSERSAGLRWYLETFIDAQANDVREQRVVYLLDEPGTSLHVNAQRELLHLFNHLAAKGNQVVYTTHSPYMLDLETEGIHRIRAVVKNTDGFTYAYKTAYDSRIAPETQKDTLAPIISAIGMNLNVTFGPAENKINIVTEGMSDYIYLTTMVKVLGVNIDKYTILPAVGASNCVNICSILHGWGCRYIALFDYDTEGVKKGGEYLQNNMLLEYKKQYCYVADVTQDDVDRKTYTTDTSMIEDIVTRKEIDKYCTANNIPNTTGKTLVAKMMSNAIEAGTYQLGDECKANFQKLFDRIFSYFINE